MAKKGYRGSPIINIKGSPGTGSYRAHSTLSKGNNDSGAKRKLMDGPAPPPKIGWGTGKGQVKPKDKIGGQNVLVPQKKPRGARFVRGFGEYSDK